MNAVQGRYLYRKATAPEYSAWDYLTVAQNESIAAHDALVAAWNERDAGRLMWMWQQMLPNDIDFISTPAEAPLTT